MVVTLKHLAQHCLDREEATEIKLHVGTVKIFQR